MKTVETFVPAGTSALDLRSMLRLLNPVENLMMGTHCVVKEFIMPAGSRIVQHRHKYPHPGVLVSGEVTLRFSDDSLAHPLRAPATLTLAAHIEHRIEAVTDAVWLCIHPDNEEAKWVDS